MSLNEKINGKTVLVGLGLATVLGLGGKMALDDYRVEQERVNPTHIKLHGFEELTNKGYKLEKVEIDSKQRAYITDITRGSGTTFNFESTDKKAKYNGPIDIVVDFNHPTTYAVSTKPSDSYATKTATLYFKK